MVEMSIGEVSSSQVLGVSRKARPALELRHVVHLAMEG
jgi:hypothetical protein